MKDYSIGKSRRNFDMLWRNLAIFAITALIVGTFLLREVYSRSLQPVSSSQQSILVTIPEGASIMDISQKLRDMGLIKNSWSFEWYVRNNKIHDRLQAGTYYLSPSQGVVGVIGSITNGVVATDLFTILPAQRLDQVQSALINNGGFSPEEASDALNPDNYQDHPALEGLPTGASLEGYVYPESFQTSSKTTAQDLVRLSLDELNKVLTDEIKAAAAENDLSIHEFMTIASIVENEVGNNEDRRTVAQVFLTRYKNKIQLGSDVTSIYGALRDSVELPLDATEAVVVAIGHDSVYNTRIYDGLPPGPISNISKSTLEALANPTDTDYLYFVSGDDGKTYFSHTLDQHESLTAQYCKEGC
jgi:UPF0755 protein